MNWAEVGHNFHSATLVSGENKILLDVFFSRILQLLLLPTASNFNQRRASLFESKMNDKHTQRLCWSEISCLCTAFLLLALFFSLLWGQVGAPDPCLIHIYITFTIGLISFTILKPIRNFFFLLFEFVLFLWCCLFVFILLFKICT